jgi:hypothetical protein
MLRPALADLFLFLPFLGTGCGSTSPLDVIPQESAEAAYVDNGSTLTGAGGGTGAPGAEQGGAPGGITGGTRTADASTDPFLGPPVCTSGTSWISGNRGSPLMHPGLPCLSCHRGGGAPPFFIAGTVYPTAHEPNDCDGSLIGLQASVVVTGADGITLTFPVNSVGNFYSARVVPVPFTAKVVAGDAERVMTTPQTNGDCNSCHTEGGANGAPGRIVLP